MAHILIVDDEPDIRHLVRLIFELAGHQVTEASNGVVAMQRILERAPDLVVTDVMMPMMNGPEFIARLRADPAMSSIPILVLTAALDYEGVADAALAKPFSPKELAAVAASLLKTAV